VNEVHYLSTKKGLKKILAFSRAADTTAKERKIVGNLQRKELRRSAVPCRESLCYGRDNEPSAATRAADAAFKSFQSELTITGR